MFANKPTCEVSAEHVLLAGAHARMLCRKEELNYITNPLFQLNRSSDRTKNLDNFGIAMLSFLFKATFLVTDNLVSVCVTNFELPVSKLAMT